MRFCRLSAGVVLLTAAVFALGVGGGHLGVDDWSYTYGCEFVRTGLSWTNVGRAFSEIGYCAIWMPLTFVSYMADFTLFGGGWPVHHAVNVALHAVNAGLVFAFLLMLVRRFGRAEGKGAAWTCAAAALVWALHPMRAEAVAFVASRKEELWTLFALAGLMAWIGFIERGGAVRYLLTLLFGTLACLSKPTAVCFPILAWILQVMVTRRPFRRWWAYLPMLAVSAFVGLAFSYSQSHPTGLAPSEMFVGSLDWRLLNAGVSLGLYVWHTFVPTGVRFDYRAVFGGWPVDGGIGLATLALAVFVTAWAVLFGAGKDRPADSGRIRRAVVFSVAWFLVGILPTLGVFGYVNGDQALADRYSYLPSIAFSILLALTVVPNRLAAALAAAALAAEVAFAVPVIRSFADDYSAFSRTLAKDPDHWRALRVVGNEYCARRGRMDEGVALLRKSLRNHGSQLTADSLAYVLAIRGRPEDLAEVRRLGAAVARDFRRDVNGMMLDALGIAYLREGDDRNAAKLFKAALGVPRRNHSPGHSLLNLGLALANLGRDAEARTALEKAAKDVNPEVRTRAAEALGALHAGGRRPRFPWKP